MEIVNNILKSWGHWKQDTDISAFKNAAQINMNDFDNSLNNILKVVQVLWLMYELHMVFKININSETENEEQTLSVMTPIKNFIDINLNFEESLNTNACTNIIS